MVPDGYAARKLEKDLFEVSASPEGGELGEAQKEEDLVEELDEDEGRVDVPEPAEWGSIRRRVSGASGRISNGIRRVFRGP